MIRKQRPTASKRVRCICTRCNHRYDKTLHTIWKGVRCQYCGGNVVESKYAK